MSRDDNPSGFGKAYEQLRPEVGRDFFKKRERLLVNINLFIQ